MTPEEMWRVLFGIRRQATRRHRAVGLKTYLERDLDIIAEKCAKALKELEPRKQRGAQ